MTSDMNWSKIDLDHVLPLSSFNLTDPVEAKETSHFSKLQSIIKSDDMKASTYRELDLAV